MLNSMFSALMCIKEPPVNMHIADVGEAYNSAFLIRSTKRKRTRKFLLLHGPLHSGRSHGSTLEAHSLSLFRNLMHVPGIIKSDATEINYQIKTPTY